MLRAPDPNGAGLARAIKIAFEEANVADDAQLYINAHGTSTHLNDLTETMAIKTALGEKAYDANITNKINDRSSSRCNRRS